VMDFGGRVGGYCSDITRTVVVRQHPREFDHVYEVVREAQDRAFRAVKPGVPAEEIDRAAREVIETAGFGDLFVHRTGHGIGLEVHEEPYLVGGNRQPLRPGMCFSIEPGIYLEGRFGVRIEDIVAVTEDGAQRLNHAERDLQVVG
jgi:Xaa-Pro aminopeptidase